ncbi:hypothetical protein AGMMS49982_15580 [Bacteroidia bacterium]|nr:hypothetical protein AGMMS49982_15580 [Bacteroidia bacterium]
MKKIALVVGGSNGIGLALCSRLLQRDYTKVYVVDRRTPAVDLGASVVFVPFNLLNEDFSVFEQFADIDTLLITSGFGRVALFDSLTDKELQNIFKVNSIAVSRIIKHFYPKIQGQDLFFCGVMGSIAGLISSPMFAAYGASKAAVCKLIESLNIELEMSRTPNRILNVSPGSIKGTSFNGGQTDLKQTEQLANQILDELFQQKTLFIPEYAAVYKGVLQRYSADPHAFGVESYGYKANSGRVATAPQVKIGYLSGTFDLFHIGHLNLLKRAKEYCDYLVVGVHKDALRKGKETFIPLEERMDIVRSSRYVDEVILSYPEDMDAYAEIKYDYLFVGSDYKGTERFNRYEAYFKDKNVEIVYFPYTQGTSSTQLRNAIESTTSKLIEQND